MYIYIYELSVRLLRYLSTVLYANLWEEASAQTAKPLE